MKRLTKKQWKRKYYYLYNKANKLIKDVNPCKWKNDRCDEHNNTSSGCCGACKYLSNKGCTVKALQCKLWLCSYLHKKYPELSKALNELWRVANRNLGLQYGIRQNMAEIIENIQYHGYKFKR